MNRKSDRQKRRLLRDRGVVMVEFALMMPLWLTVFAGFVEVPRMMAYRPRAINSARIVADFRGRNDDKLPSDQNKKMIEKILWADFGGKPSMTVIDEKIMTAKAAETMKKYAGNTFVKVVVGLLTAGEWSRLFTQILDADTFSAGKVRIEAYTILPVEFLEYFIGWHGGSKLKITSPVCRMPNQSGRVKSNPSVWEGLKDLF